MLSVEVLTMWTPVKKRDVPSGKRSENSSEMKRMCLVWALD